MPISNTIGWLHPFPNPKSLTRSVGFTSMLLRRDSLKHCVSFSFGMRGFICLLLAALLWHRMLLMRKGCCLEPALILGGVEHRLSNLTVFLSFGGVRSMPEDSGHGSYQKRFSPWELWHIRSRSETGQGTHIPSHAHAIFHVCKKIYRYVNESKNVKSMVGKQDWKMLKEWGLAIESLCLCDFDDCFNCVWAFAHISHNHSSSLVADLGRWFRFFCATH